MLHSFRWTSIFVDDVKKIDFKKYIYVYTYMHVYKNSVDANMG